MQKKLILPLAVLLSACGQKGPLYLPQDPAAPAQPAAVAAPVSGTATTTGEEPEKPRAQTGDAVESSGEPEAEK
ncbi:LPS translocon maturation chaperone LptM [Microbulbifer taiwanensis]|uniref:Lipoprotein n=1 Tax=Microbulbifer taiwanensis TaxID=986746 RepID=A0ABW1YMR0_9GAMM|nr:lipoprotein [Microbulbifer taiwanensis]